MAQETDIQQKNNLPLPKPGGATGKGFVKGDPRINRKGRPKTFDQARTLSQSIAHEQARDREGNPIIIGGRAITVGEAILRQWSQSRNPKLQTLFMEYCFGKVPNETRITGADGGPLQFEDAANLNDEEKLQRLLALAEKASSHAEQS